MDVLLRFTLVIFLGISVSANASKLPVEAFSSLPDVSHMALSPSGEYVASLVKYNRKGVEGSLVKIYNAKTKASAAAVFTDNIKYKINWLRWANDRYLLISARFPDLRWTIPTTETRLLVFDRVTKKQSNIFPSNFMSKQRFTPQFQDQIIDLLPAEPNHILIETSFKTPTSSAVYKVNVANGKRKRLVKNKDRYISWVSDRSGTPRIGIYFKDTQYKIMHRAVGQKAWEPLWEFEALSEAQVWPLDFDGDANILFVRAYHEGRLAIFKVDLQSPDLAKELVYSNKYYDVNKELIYSLPKQRVVGLKSSTGAIYFDDEYLALQGGLDKALPDTNNILLGMSHDERSYLLKINSDIDPGAYYLGNRDNNRLDVIAHRYFALLPELMSEKKAISYKARDGIEIEGFLTVPQKSDLTNLPTIIFPHGGPISNSGVGFDYWTQYFANKGYAVLQVDFRGSSGYGYDYQSAGSGNKGTKIQQDVEDGTRWLIEQGVADKSRICIVGSGYGGYAALMEARYNSDFYQCAISFAGVTDIKSLVKSRRGYTSHELIKKQLGSNAKEQKERSPLSGVDEINIPILLGHGFKDRAVPVTQSQRMYKALKRAGKDVRYIELDKGDHYLGNEENRREFFQEMDQFLDKHLGQAL